MVGSLESGRLHGTLHLRAHLNRRDGSESPRNMPVQPLICTYSPLRGNCQLSQFVEQSLGLFEVGGIEPFGKPAVEHTRAENRGSRHAKANSGERQTLRWREKDSNPRSPVTGPKLFRDSRRSTSLSLATARAAPSLGDRKRPTGRYSRPRICCSIGASTRAAAAQAASFGCIWSPQSYPRR
jgi:hypothetical protein